MLKFLLQKPLAFGAGCFYQLLPVQLDLPRAKTIDPIELLVVAAAMVLVLGLCFVPLRSFIYVSKTNIQLF